MESKAHKFALGDRVEVSLEASEFDKTFAQFEGEIGTVTANDALGYTVAFDDGTHVSGFEAEVLNHFG